MREAAPWALEQHACEMIKLFSSPPQPRLQLQTGTLVAVNFLHSWHAACGIQQSQRLLDITVHKKSSSGLKWAQPASGWPWFQGASSCCRVPSRATEDGVCTIPQPGRNRQAPRHHSPKFLDPMLLCCTALGVQGGARSLCEPMWQSSMLILRGSPLQ